MTDKTIFFVQCLCLVLLLVNISAVHASPDPNEEEYVDDLGVYVNETTPTTLRFEGKGKPTTIKRELISVNQSCLVKVTWTNASFDIGPNRDSSLVSVYVGPDPTGEWLFRNRYIFWVKQFEPLEQCIPEGCGLIWEYDCRVEDCRLLGDSAYSTKQSSISIHFKTDIGLNTTFFEFQYQLFCGEAPTRPPSELHLTDSPSNAPTKRSCKRFQNKKACKRLQSKKACNRYTIQHGGDQPKNGCQWNNARKTCQAVKC